MRTRLLSIAILFASLFTIAGRAQEVGMHYVYFADGKVWGYPQDFVREIKQDANTYILILENDSTISWPAEQVHSISDIAPEYPQFTTFELDDKRNDQLYRDVEAMVSANEVSASISGIGKYLTPSFTMDMAGAVAYVGGEEQVSGESRLRFADEVIYTLGHPNYQRLSVEKVSDEVWSEPEAGAREIELTVDMLSTNAPSGRGEGLDKMIDGNPSTIFHSTWTNDPVYGSPDVSQQVYISVKLPYAISDLRFYYIGRTDTSKYNVYEWRIEASNDGVWWTEIDILNESDGIPTSGRGVSYTSPTISLGKPYSYLRFTASSVGYKNYLCLSEFSLYEMLYEDNEPELLQPAQYAYQMIPMGRKVSVHIDWLTDQATSVPCIYIDIENGEMVSSKSYYLNADISFVGNGVWEDYDFESAVQIKGRGNSSWSTPSYYYDPKNPYRLKFEESVKPFGMKKGKNWNLIAQKQSGSLMTNPVAHKIARMVGLQTANDVVPVELYMNGEYRGSYFFTQKVGMANNSVDFDDESMAALFELDSYSESGQFDSYTYGLPVNIKAPEFGEDETNLDYYGVMDEFNRFETAVYTNSNYERFVDMDMLVRYMLVNDLVLNTELGHPKSAYLSRENMEHMSSRYTFGPAWDFDWAYGYEGTSSYCTDGATRDLFSYFHESGTYFYSDILRSSTWVQYHYYKLWEEFIDKHLDELIDFVDDYYAYARSSFEHNATMWGDGRSYDKNIANMKSWLRERAHYIKNSLTPYETEPFTYGDLNSDGIIDNIDVEYMLAYLFENEEEGMNYKQADADANDNVSISDLTWINLLVEDKQKQQQARSRRDAKLWSIEEETTDCYDFDIDDMPNLTPAQNNATHRAQMRANTQTEGLDLKVTPSWGRWNATVSFTNTTPYIAFSMDFVLPDAFTLSDGNTDVTLAPRTEETHVLIGQLIDKNRFRVIGYSENNATLQGNEGELFTLDLHSTPSLAPSTYSLSVENVRFVTANAFEESMPNTGKTFEVTKEQLTQVIAPATQNTCWPADIYDIHGRMLRKGATSLKGLSRGVYIINQQKVVKP